MAMWRGPGPPPGLNEYAKQALNPYHGWVESSPPITLHWNGWTAEAHVLERYGWEFCVEQRPENFSTSVAFKDSKNGVYGRTEDINNEVLRDAKLGRLDLRCECFMGKDIIMHTMGSMSMAPVSMERELLPQSQYNRMTLHLSDLFKSYETKDSGLLVPEDTVPDLLDRLLELQEPARQESIKKRVRENNRSVIIPTNIVQLKVA